LALVAAQESCAG